jgi:starch-binding outer membrane protein, SusD/RagB family
MRRNTFGGRLTRAVIGLGLASTAACSSLTDSLLEATDPDVIPPGNVNSVEGAKALATGTLARLTAITGGNESTWLFGGLLADEWSTSSTFVQNDETDQRAIQENNSQITGMLYRLFRTRTVANQALAKLREFTPTASTSIGETLFARGFAELQLASDFCNGIPLSDGTEEVIVFGEPKTVAEVFNGAIAAFDSAIALTGGTDVTSILVNRAARVAKARAQLGVNQIDAAAATVAGIPTSFTYQSTFSLTTMTNTIWGQGLSAQRYSVGDSVEGNQKNILVPNAIPFASSKDPRLPVVIRTTAGQDGQTFVRTSTIYGQLTSVDVVNGLDARMIEAEKALRDGNVAQWLSIHNALRAAPPVLGTVTVPPMPALTDPGTPAARINLHFREKAFWTFSRGQRLGDLRRLIRQYGRTPANTFPTGTHYKGGVYGSDVNLPIVTDERNNPNFKGCLDRNA